MTNSMSTGEDGLVRFAREAAQLAATAPPGRHGATWFISEMGERYAHIRLQDAGRPLRFLRQMASAPPVRLGKKGFRPDILDDFNPARHYTAFVWVGYWLPYPLAIAVIYLWEIAGFVRYRGLWSQADVVCGLIGVRHGRQVRRSGANALPHLIVTELADPHQIDVADLAAEIDRTTERGL